MRTVMRLISEGLRTWFLSFSKPSLGRAAEETELCEPGFDRYNGDHPPNHLSMPCKHCPDPLSSVVLFSHPKNGAFGVPGLRPLLPSLLKDAFAGATWPVFPIPSLAKLFLQRKSTLERIYYQGWAGRDAPMLLLEEFLPKSVSKLCNPSSRALGGDFPHRAGLLWGLQIVPLPQLFRDFNHLKVDQD